MSKAEIIAQVAQQAGESKKATAAVLEAFTSHISSELQSKRQVRWAGLGTFGTNERSARTGVNPRTHEPMNIPAKTVPTFKFAKTIKDTTASA